MFDFFDSTCKIQVEIKYTLTGLSREGLAEIFYCPIIFTIYVCIYIYSKV